MTCKQMVPICSGSIHHHFHDPTGSPNCTPPDFLEVSLPPSSTSSLLQSMVQVSSNCKKRPASNSSMATRLKVQKDRPKHQLSVVGSLLEISHISSYSVNKYIPGGFFRMSAPMLSFSNTWVGKSHPLKNSKWSRG